MSDTGGLNNEEAFSLMDSAKVSMGICIFIWIAFVIDTLMGKSISSLGISPRETSTLLGILISPVMHLNLAHIISNTMPLFVLTTLFFHKTNGDIVKYVGITLLSGILLWMMGTGGGTTIHIGASSLIFGLFGYLVLSGIFKKDIKGIVISVVVAFLYSGILIGIIPQDNGVSWDGHFFGLIAGALFAMREKKGENKN